MLDFATRWSRHGGGSSEDIFVTFGLTPRQYFLRLRTLLAHPSLVESGSGQQIRRGRRAHVCRRIRILPTSRQALDRESNEP